MPPLPPLPQGGAAVAGGGGGGITEGQTVLPCGGDENDAVLTRIGRTTMASRTYQMPRRTEPSQVDLLITIRDDTDDDATGNLRSDAPSGNFGSRGSLTSGGPQRLSPDEGATNATNASILARKIAAAQAQAQAAQAQQQEFQLQQQQQQQQQPNHVQGTHPHHAQVAAALNRPIIPPATEATEATSSPPVRRTVSYDATADGAVGPGAGGGRSCSPAGRPVDLMMDMVRGGVLVRNPMDGVEEPRELAGSGGGGGAGPGNGTVAMWSRKSPYKRLQSKEGESCV